MNDFSKLLYLLEKEAACHERFLKLLSEERAAIVKLNQEQIQKINLKKEDVLKGAQAIESERQEVIERLLGVVSPDRFSRNEGPKFRDILEKCPTGDLKRKLETVGQELKKTVIAVKELNHHNAELIRQSLGIISSTISIMQSGTAFDLPTYSQSGTLRSEEETRPPSGRVTREV